MPDDPTEIAARLARGGRGIGDQLKRMIGRLLSEHLLAQRVFLGPDGKPTPAAAEWLGRLARDNFVESTTFVGGDRDQMLINEGRRKLALKILGSVHLDTERLGALTKLERES